jgi:vitamin B12 transporter
MNAFNRRSRTTLGALSTAALVAGAPAQAEATVALDELVVTATGRPEIRSQISATLRIIDQDKIAHPGAKLMTDLLAKNAVGFFSEWTAAQTSFNFRGASADGQGRDFKSMGPPGR